MSSRRQQGLDVLGGGVVVEVAGGVAEGVEQGFRLGGGLLLQEAHAALHVHRGGPAEGPRRVHPVVQDHQPHHHAQHQQGCLLAAELCHQFAGNEKVI